MDKEHLKEQVETIRQAFGYINRFKNETFVIKIESSLLTSTFFPILIKDIAILHDMGIRIVLVPGAKTRIDDVLKAYNMQSDTINNIRVSPPEAIPFIKMAAFDVSNTVMTMLAANNTNAVIGNWVRAKSIGVLKGVDFKNSGAVERLQTDIIKNVLEEGLVPIFPNIGWNAKGKPYNLSSNELAYTISSELKAAKLFFITDFGGISAQGLTLPENVYVTSENYIAQLTIDEAKKLLALNKQAPAGQALELVSLAHRACAAGVQRVHVIDGRVEGMLLKEIFSNRGFGTMIYVNQFENIRPMQFSDIPDVLRMMQPLIEKEILVARTAEQLEATLSDYCVYEVDGTVHGCGALHEYGNQAEIAGIAVDTPYNNLGIGEKIVSYCKGKAIEKKLKQVFVLTTQSADWFLKLGFAETTFDNLPAERKLTYNKKRKSLILVQKL